MNGMHMMLKSMGVDPDSIGKQAEEIGGAVKQMAEAMQRIEAQNNRIIAMLEMQQRERAAAVAQIAPAHNKENDNAVT